MIRDGWTSVKGAVSRSRLLGMAPGLVLLNNLMFVSWTKSRSTIIIKVFYEEFSNPVND